MGKNSQFYQEKKAKQIQVYEKLKQRLPNFAIAFLNSKHKITQSSKNLYAKDLLRFFEYIVDADEKLFGRNTRDIELVDISYYKDELFDAYVDSLLTDLRGKRTGNNRTSAEHKLVVLRNLYHYYNSLGAIPSNPLEFYEKYGEPKDKVIIRMTVEEVDNMLLATSSGANIKMTPRMAIFYEKTRQRDYAIVKLFLGTGIRVSELVGADIKDLDLQNNSLTIVRKGEHMDIVYFLDDVRNALFDYIEGERKRIKTEDEMPLFYSNRGLRISVGNVERIVKKYAEVVSGKNITAHKLRATYGTQLYKKTGDLALVQDALGHSSPETTKRSYVDSRADNMKKAGAVNLYN